MNFTLAPHPAAPPSDPELKLWARVEHSGSLGAVATTNIWFGVGAPLDRFAMPAGEPGRADDLWETTCFEAFLRRPDAEPYQEWNFAPNCQWAAYDFAGYRDKSGDADIASPPYVRMEDNFTWWALGATFAIEPGEWLLGLSAILEETDGTKSYWALAHPPGDRPDFHDAVCFAARLA